MSSFFPHHLFRSEEMNFYSLAMTRESAWDILNELGEISCLQFIDQQPNVAVYTRPFSNFIKRCEEAKLKLDYIEEQMKMFGIPIKRCGDYQYFLKKLRSQLASRDKAEKTYFEDLEHDIQGKHEHLVSQIAYFENITNKMNNLLEYRSVLWKASSSLMGSHSTEGSFGYFIYKYTYTYTYIFIVKIGLA